jgi:hypothetical protein
MNDETNMTFKEEIAVWEKKLNKNKSMNFACIIIVIIFSFIGGIPWYTLVPNGWIIHVVMGVGAISVPVIQLILNNRFNKALKVWKADFVPRFEAAIDSI